MQSSQPQTSKPLTVLLSFLAVICTAAALPSACAQDAALTNPREIPEGARFVIMSDYMANMIEQKHGLPMTTGRYPLAGLVVFPNQNLAPDLKERINSKFLGLLPMNYAQVVPHFFHALPPNDLVKISVPLNPAPVRRSNTGIAVRPKRSDEQAWLVAHQDGESFQLPGDRTAVLLASPGTIFNAAGKKEAIIKAGSLWIFSDSNAITLHTRHGDLLVPPFSIVAVEQTFFGKLSVVALDGRPARLTWRPGSTNTDEHKVQVVEAGHQLVVRDKLVAAAGTSDFVASSTLPSSAPGGLEASIASVTGEECSLVKELIKRRPPFSSFDMERRYEHMMKRYSLSATERMRKWSKPAKQEESPQPSTYSASLDQRYFVPVFKNAASTKPLSTAKAVETKTELRSKLLKRATAKYLSDAAVNIDEFGRINLQNGELLVCAHDSIRIKIGEAEVYLAKGAIALVNYSGGVVGVRNLKEMHNQNVSLVYAGRSMKCSVGHELLAAGSLGAISREMAEDRLQRRCSQISEFNNGNATINKSEFSITSALAASPLLRRVYHSKDEIDRRITDELVKMDACLTLVAGGKGAYRPSVPPIPAGISAAPQSAPH